MTKILRVKKGTCHIENCGRCPAGSSDGLSDMFLGRFTRCGFTAYVYKADRLPKYPMCPLDDLVEEKQAPAEQPYKASGSAEYLDKKKNDNLIKDNSQLKDRIAQQDSVYQRLERLEDQQKRILGDLNEAYPAGTLRKTTGAKIKELDRRIEALEKGASYVLKVKDEKPAEPEMEKRIAALEARPVTYPQPTPYPWNQFWYTSTTAPQFNPCQNCQTMKEFNAQHPSGFVGDSPCSTCPNNPYRVTCSK